MPSSAMSQREKARQAFTLFWRQAWAPHSEWEDVEPWERQAWEMVVEFVETGALKNLEPISPLLGAWQDETKEVVS